MTRDEQLRLFEEHRALALRIADGFRFRVPRWIEANDLRAAALAGLWKSVLGCPATGDEFEAYARVRIRGSVLDDLRRQDMLPRSLRAELRRAGVSISRVFEVISEDLPAPGDDPADLIDERAQVLALRAALATLGERDSYIIQEHMRGIRQTEIAEALGLSPPRISQIISRITERIREQLSQQAPGAQ